MWVVSRPAPVLAPWSATGPQQRHLNQLPVQFRVAASIDRIVAVAANPDPHLLVTGFWRSGTTWVQNALARAIGAKTIFEPFSPKARPPFNSAPRSDGADWACREVFMPPSFEYFSAQDIAYLDAIFAGHCSAAFSFMCRRKIAESLRRRVVIKLVRSALVLEDLIERYDIRVVHVSRHPCAVIASFLQNTDWDWTFDEVHFEDVFGDALRNGTAGDLAALVRYDGRPAYERVAAYWALTEKRVHALQHERLLKTDYDTVATIGEPQFRKIVNFAGGNRVEAVDLDEASVVTVSWRSQLSRRERVESWRKALDPATRARVLEVVGEIWPEHPYRAQAAAPPDGPFVAKGTAGAASASPL